MDELSVVRVVDRAGVLRAQLKFRASQVAIGRGYDNDVVLEDEFADSRHAVVRLFVGGRIEVEDLGTRNGTRVGEEKINRESTHAELGTPITIGQSTVTIHSPAEAEVEARDLPPDPRVRIDYSRLPAWILTGLVVSYGAIGTWLSAVHEVSLAEVLGAAMLLAMLLLGWAGVWAVGTRVFSDRARFRQHLGFIAAVALVVTPISTLLEWGIYALNSEVVSLVSGFLTGFIVVAVVIFGHIDIASRRTERFKMVVAGSVGAFFMAIAAVAIQVELGPALTIQRHLQPIPPVPAQLTRSESVESFLEEIRPLESMLDEAAVEH